MIQIGELRIGNLVGLNNRVVRVESLNEGWSYFGGEQLEIGRQIVLLHVLFEKAEGIPLTLDWLERCGFEQKEVVNSDQDERTFWAHPKMNYYTYDGKKFDAGYGFGDLDHVKYIHQVQNLFFALAGEELTIKS